MSLKLEAMIGLNSEQFEKGIDRAKDSTADLVKSLVIGAIGVSTLDAAFEKTVETATRFVNQAKQLDITVEQVQLLTAAAKEAGQEFDVVGKSLEKINEARGKALGGDRAAVAGFRALGIDQNQLNTQSAATIFQNIGNAVKGQNIEPLVGPLKEVLGKGADEAVGVLKTNFEELGEKMKDTGQIMSTETAVKLKLIGDEFDSLSRIFTNILAPSIVAFVNSLMDSASKYLHYVDGVINKEGEDHSKDDEYLASDKTNRGQNSLWVNTKGVLQGVMGSLDYVVGSAFSDNLKQTGMERLVRSQLAFTQTGAGNGKTLDAALGTIAQKATVSGGLGGNFDAVRTAMEKQALDSAAPKKADYNIARAFADQVKGESRAYKAPEDALIRVGNFLGSSKGVINSAQARLEQHAAATASNTQQMLAVLKGIAGHFGGPAAAAAVGSALKTEFPAN